MTIRLIPKLFLGLLLVGCAHDQGNKDVHGAHNAQQAEREHAQHHVEGKRRSRDEHAAHGEPVRKQAPRDQAHTAQGQGAAAGQDGNNTEPMASAERAADQEQRTGTPTAGHQGNSDIDVDLTQRIRKAVMHDDSLSFSAKNVKIITRDGHVTLRGRVQSSAEKDAIYQAALREAGAGHVTNQLEPDQG